jgi:hypothetical protein
LTYSAKKCKVKVLKKPSVNHRIYLKVSIIFTNKEVFIVMERETKIQQAQGANQTDRYMNEWAADHPGSETEHAQSLEGNKIQREAGKAKPVHEPITEIFY